MSNELKIPQVGEYLRDVGKLIKVEEIVPTQPQKDYIFEDIEYKCDLYLDDELLKSLTTYGNFRQHAIDDMSKYCADRKINKNDRLEMRITEVKTQVRRQFTSKESFYNEGYPEFVRKDIGCYLNLPEPVETIVWSSKKL
jgi:hypothetical protein